MKLSKLSKTSLLLFICFGIDKVTAILRQLIIARQFGMSPELDIFNIANNLPDMLFILISGGAMAMVIIPVMTEILDKESQSAAWHAFSSIVNLSFLASLILAVVIAFFAEPIVKSEIGIAPGFSIEQQAHVVTMMRLNLIATLIFSISGLVMGSLQAHQKFLLPALAPILYNVGQIFGAVILAPTSPYRIGGIALPHFGMGIYGLVAGVIAGAISHLLIQVPGLIKLHFRWTPLIDFKDLYVVKMIRILIPRVLTVFFVQLIFIIRDNLASRLAAGSVTALSYGYMFQQLPETLIGTALGTAILPSLSLFYAEKDHQGFFRIIRKAIRLVLAASFGIGVLMAIGLGPLIQAALAFEPEQHQLLVWTLRGFLVGLTGHCLLEVANRAFYAQQEPVFPLLGTILNLFLYLVLGISLYRPLNAPGISLTDSISFTIQALFLLWLLYRPAAIRIKIRKMSSLGQIFGLEAPLEAQQTGEGSSLIGRTLLRSVLGAIVAGLVCLLILSANIGNGNILVKSIVGLMVGTAVYVPFIIPEIKLFRQF